MNKLNKQQHKNKLQKFKTWPQRNKVVKFLLILLNNYKSTVIFYDPL